MFQIPSFGLIVGQTRRASRSWWPAEPASAKRLLGNRGGRTALTWASSPARTHRGAARHHPGLCPSALLSSATGWRVPVRWPRWRGWPTRANGGTCGTRSVDAPRWPCVGCWSALARSPQSVSGLSTASEQVLCRTGGRCLPGCASRPSAARCSGWMVTSWTPPSITGLLCAPNHPPGSGERWPLTARLPTAERHGPPPMVCYTSAADAAGYPRRTGGVGGFVSQQSSVGVSERAWLLGWAFWAVRRWLVLGRIVSG
jgi:hypothetical protein